LSSGHHHQESAAVSSETLNKILAMAAVRERMWQLREEDNSADIPYIAGYSNDRKTIFYDRHLPETIVLRHDGRTHDIRPRDHIRPHETIEPVVMDVLGWTYFPAHAVATAYEKRQFIQRVGPEWWMPYTYAMDGYAKADETERVTKVPRDLDMAPYLAPPVNRRLVEAMKRAMGQGSEKKEPKALAHYTAMGRPAEHCGPVAGWPKGNCEHYEAPNACEIVAGHIVERGWCRHWSEA
jgi:hypothetical protein